MPGNTRNDILDAFKAVIDAVPPGEFGQPSAIIGLLKPNDLGAKPRAEVWWHNDFGSHVDTNSENTLRVVTSVKFKYDESDKTDRGATQLHQASAMYDAIHAAIETAYNTRGQAATPFSVLGKLIITQEPPGIQPSGFNDGDDYMHIGEVWEVKYNRAQGAT
jgi:hypothetical protein